MTLRRVCSPSRDRVLEDPQCGSGPDSTEEVLPTVFGDRNRSVVPGSLHNELPQELEGEGGHVAGHHKTVRRRTVDERGRDASDRSVCGPKVSNLPDTGDWFTSHDTNVSGRAGECRNYGFDQRSASPGQTRFVLAHSGTSAPGQNVSSHRATHGPRHRPRHGPQVHERILALQNFFTGSSHGNGSRLAGRQLAVCLIAAAASSLYAGSVPKPPVHVRSVVRTSASGKLVRTVVVTPRVVVPKPVTEISAASSTAITDDQVSIPELVRSTAQKYEVDPLLVHSVIQVESNYNPYAISPKGAQGIMQLMPGTARRFGVSHPFDARDNIEGGVRYLKYLQTLFPDDLRLAIAAYNAGEGAVWKFNNQIPPYPETEQYVYKVGSRYGRAKKQAPGRAGEPGSNAVTRADASTRADAGGPADKAETASTPAAPSYAPVRYSYDANGNLYLRTEPVSEADKGGLRTQ